MSEHVYRHMGNVESANSCTAASVRQPSAPTPSERSAMNRVISSSASSTLGILSSVRSGAPHRPGPMGNVMLVDVIAGVVVVVGVATVPDVQAVAKRRSAICLLY